MTDSFMEALDKLVEITTINDQIEQKQALRVEIARACQRHLKSIDSEITVLERRLGKLA